MDAPSSFTMADYYAKNPSGWILKNESQVETIELKVKGFALDTLKNNRLAEDQELTPTTTEWVNVRFSCIPTYDLVAWILRYGADVICEAPTYLKNKVITAIKNTLKNYEY